MKHIAILGAGAIGCYVGASWAKALSHAKIKLTLIGRPNTLNFGGADILTISGDKPYSLACDLFERSEDPSALKDADVILVATKATALERAIEDIQTHISPNAIIISLLNGLEPVRHLRSAFPDHTVLAGMVPFNVVWQSANHLHKSSAGTLSLESAPTTKTIESLVASSPTPLALYDDLQPIQYGKLLLNLINPINALSGIPLHDMLSQKGFRQIYATTLSEALTIYDQCGIVWEKVGPISPRLAIRLLPSPDAFFNNTLLKLQKIDKTSMTSMGADVYAGKPTEITVINDEIVRLAKAQGLTAPINTKLTALIRDVEKTGLLKPFSATQLKETLGL